MVGQFLNVVASSSASAAHAIGPPKVLLGVTTRLREIGRSVSSERLLGLAPKAPCGRRIFRTNWHSHEEFLDNNIELGNEL
jgi:hypothetical protein